MNFDINAIPMWSVWLTLTIVLGICEIFSTAAIAMCLAIATFAAMIASFIGAPTEVQIVVMAIASVLSLIFIAPIARELLRKSAPPEREAASNMDALIGLKIAIPANLPAGQMTRVKINGDNWQVRSADDNVAFLAGEQAEICGYDSIVLLVKRI